MAAAHEAHEARELMRLGKAAEMGDAATAEMALRDLEQEMSREKYLHTVEPAVLLLCARAKGDETLLDELERMLLTGGVLAAFAKEDLRRDSRGNTGSTSSEVRGRIQALQVGRAARQAAAATRAAMEAAMEATVKPSPGHTPDDEQAKARQAKARPPTANKSARSLYRAAEHVASGY